MPRIICVCLIILLSYSTSTFSQTRKEKKLAEKKRVEQVNKRKKEVKDSLAAVKKARGGVPENIEVFPKNFLFKPKFVYPLVVFNVTSRQNKGSSFNWQPAMPGLVGLAIRIKKVYAAAMFRLPASKALTQKYGDTKFRDIYVNIQGRIVSWGIFYRDYKGFYLADYKKFYPKWNEDSLGFPTSKNLHIIEGGLNLGFNFNKNFSLNAAFAQSERQKKSAGSFLMTLSERYQRIETDSNIVPVDQAVNYPTLDRYIGGDFFTTIFSIGGGYQVVMGKFHFTPVVLLGSGVQIQNYQQPGKNLWRLNIPTYAHGRAQIGYNGNKFFTNIIYSIEFNTVPIKESRIRLYRQAIEFGLGVRF